MNDLNSLLAKYRDASKTEREKGTYFELLIKDFLKSDPRYAPQFVDIFTYAEWAEKQGIDKADIGIDLVAELINDEGYCAIQCKFYAEDHKIQKSDIDSFFTASGKHPFTRRLVVDSTRRDWSKHAENSMIGQQIPVQRIGLNELEESPIDWSTYTPSKPVTLKPKNKLRDYQEKALNEVKSKLKKADRGKLIMACGTGKTFTSLKIAEDLAGAGKQVLFLVPSLSLMSQTITEWAIHSELPIRAFAVCSDSQVGKRKVNNDDIAEINAHDLAYPATTDAKKLAREVNKETTKNHMTVIFSTYQSIQTISDAQHLSKITDNNIKNLPEFDLIICDEAHRTTGATLASETDSNFVKVHNQNYIKGKKRIYMTATPRIFSDAVKSAANQADAVLCSMDDESMFGKTLYQISFTEAVARKCLTDYKVLVLAIDETMVSSSIQSRLADADSELVLDDATKIIGCYRALSKLDLQKDVVADPLPMKRAVAFCKDIKSSKLIEAEFTKVIQDYIKHELKDLENPIKIEVQHVDGTFNATARNACLNWLKELAPQDTCRILTNARCLSEGVDVPALDAILFMHPRKSQIDVVQSVGRVMRRAEGKNMGYVILPIGVPAGLTPEEALRDNKKYKIVWDVLNALRSHDERFDATINKMDLGTDVSSKIEVIAVTESLPEKARTTNNSSNIGSEGGDDNNAVGESANSYTANPQMPLVFDEFQKAIYAKIVKKCGTRNYWSDWANDIAKIAQTHISRITGILEDKQGEARQAFDEFLAEIRDDLNESISEDDAIEMLAQHIITKPVFDALFDNYSFAQHNPVSKAMQSILAILDEHNLEKESESLHKFYESVKLRAEGIDNIEGKQKIIVELYDKFFRNAFPRMTEKLGIVYTPVEVVDFIIHSINDVLKTEFNQTLGSKNIHILDPFTGTGTFITRLLQSGLISKDELEYKYKHEIHANEIVLLAYYIAAINIEQVYHDLSGEYAPFEGICLTDTFQLYEKEDLISNLLADNSSRREKQKKLDIRVIMGNPPYSAGQNNANDNNANVYYEKLDSSIENTYVKESVATSSKNLYDSYIRGIRWASDRIQETGVVCFISGNSFIDKPSMDGLRKCLKEEFTKTYILNLRGDIRKNMLSKGQAKEGENIFDSGSMTGIAISLFIKNPNSKKQSQVYYYDIGDNLSSDEKKASLIKLKSISGVNKMDSWKSITPDKYNDWINQRDDSFDEFIAIGDKKSGAILSVFRTYSLGLASGRDAWVYNFSKETIKQKLTEMIASYNSELEKFLNTNKDIKSKKEVDSFVDHDPTKISWNRNLKNDFSKAVRHVYDNNSIVRAMYRPFIKRNLYFNKSLNAMTYQMPRLFPDETVDNVVIMISGKGSRNGFSTFISNILPDLNNLEAGTQCFPLKLYEKTEESDNAESSQSDLFAPKTNTTEGEYTVKDGITDAGLAHFQQAYPKEDISKEDIFYYIYGLLHSEEYKTRYKDNLSKTLPRIPCVKTAKDFWTFSQAGRDLADLHINYETVEPYPVEFEGGKMFMENYTDADYRVVKMKFAKKRENGKTVNDKTTVIYNSKITMTNIPLEAYEYVVNGKPALEWVMERQCVKTDKKSGITNDANDWAIETMRDASYPLKLFQRVITVSLKTMQIVRNLPKLEID